MKSEPNISDFLTPEEKSPKWRYLQHGGYYIVCLITAFFQNPTKKKQSNLELLGIVGSLLNDFEGKRGEECIQKSKDLIALHRLVENTHARRRLERWSLRVIALYLVSVLVIVVATYANIPFIGMPWLTISDNIMIALLTTTTANIIGLGLIVLRGHFLSKGDVPDFN